ncbi:phosphate acyltransferase, partial [Acinetobacter baumannii]
KAIHRIIERARSSPRRIVLCEAEDPRVLQGAQRAAREGIARVVLIGDAARIAQAAQRHGIALDGMEVVDPASSPLREGYAQQWLALRQS